jgi:molybdate transport system substrate-binding protein
MTHPRPNLGAARLIVAAVLGFHASLASAAEIHVVSSGGFAAALKALTPGFEQLTGHKVISAWGPSMGDTPNAIPHRLERGEAIDVVIMVGDSLDDLISQGKVLKDGHALLARSMIGMAVKAGAPKPDISTPETLTKTLLAAKSIAYSDSASGVFLSTVLFPRLGIAEQLKGKARMIPAEPVGEVVARGDAEIGFQQVSELLPVAGIDFVGVLPPDAQKATPFSVGIVAGSREVEAAKTLVAYLASPAVALIKQTGLEPAGQTTRIGGGGQ